MSTFTRYELRRDAAWITLDQPERRNALSDGLVRELLGHLETAAAEPAVRAIVLTGAGGAFCAGADLKAGGGGAAAGAENAFIRVLRTIWNAPKPVVARVNGPARGGGVGLVAACDLAIAADVADFAFSEVRVGVIPAMISVVVLPKLGVQQAMWYFLTGERFSAGRAAELGLLHRVVPAAGLDAAVEEVVGLVRLGGPAAVREAKELVHRVPGMPMDEAYRWTAAKIAELFASEEAAEGMRAFVEKRKPRWAQ
ncbi:MAG TPA: enoyl-CoA hydratase-related protein [Candidatus Binatia bacterium]|nr:enoyl-CoA hydratase-related protein [Candidatus Binatia bacterium]